ncbi:MAG: hypothetical protein AB7U73_23025 [Pirellulales bacterium]
MKQEMLVRSQIEPAAYLLATRWDLLDLQQDVVHQLLQPQGPDY